MAPCFELDWRLVAFFMPVLDDLRDVPERAEQVLVKAFVPKLADEALGEGVLHLLDWEGPRLVDRV